VARFAQTLSDTLQIRLNIAFHMSKKQETGTDLAQADSQKPKPTQKLGTRKVPRNERMAEILVVAGRVFAKHGFHASSMEEIAIGAGITKPLLYRYFGSKDALYLAIIEQVGQYLSHGLNVIMSHPDPQQRLEQTMLSFLAFVERHREGWSVLYNETLTTVGPVGERVASFRGAFIDATSSTLQALLGEETQEAASKADSIAHSLVGGVEAMARWWVDHPDMGLNEVHQTLKDLYFPGLLALKEMR